MRDVTQEARDRDTQVRKALDVLQPAARLRAKAKKEIEDTLNFNKKVVDLRSDFRRTRQSRKDLNELITKLKRCQQLSRSLASQHSEWAKKPLDLSEHIERCQQELKRKRPPRRMAPRQRLAVVMARDLIDKYHPNDKKAAALTRRGCWHRLSAILAGGEARPGGDPRPDLFNHMRAINRSWLPRPKLDDGWIEAGPRLILDQI